MSNQKAIQTTWISIIGNTLLAGIKWIVGYFGNSYALIADAIESTTDIFSSILVLLGLKYASRPADKNHPYGHGRVEPLWSWSCRATDNICCSWNFSFCCYSYCN